MVSALELICTECKRRKGTGESPMTVQELRLHSFVDNYESCCANSICGRLNYAKRTSGWRESNAHSPCLSHPGLRGEKEKVVCLVGTRGGEGSDICRNILLCNV